MASSRHKIKTSSRNEEIELGSRMRGKPRRSGNAKSINSDRSRDDVEPFKAVDVVVDVHRELERKDQSSHETKETVIEVLTADVTNGDEKKNRNERRNSNEVQPRSFAAGKKSTIDESLDLIEEFHERESRHDRRTIVSQADELLLEDSIKVPRRRKQWKTSQEIEEFAKKPPRKRWSKNGSVFRLPETTKSTSSTTSSPHNSNESVPVPAPRSGLKQNSFFSFDNPAFVSDNDSEDVLRIETNCDNKETMRIEMKSKKNMTDEELSQDQTDGEEQEFEPLEPMEQKQQSSKTFEDNIETIEMSNDSDTVEESLGGEISNIASGRRKMMASKQAKSAINIEPQTAQKDITGESSESETRMFAQHSSKDTTLSTNGDSSKNFHHRSRSDQESVSTSLSNKSLKFVGDRSRLEKKPKTKTKRREEAEEVRSRNKTKKKKKSTNEKKVKKELKYISIIIHRADMLETDYITKHPMVKIHIVEAESGNYLKSTVNDANSYLQPIITGKFDFKENKSMVPVWEEEVIFEYNFDVIERTDDKRVLILFEVVDLLSFAEASCNYDRFGSEGCWYKIAWAFLKPVGVNNTLHFNKMVRLQLYRPRRIPKKVERYNCEVYHWWKSNIREKYPSSLFVTVTSVKPPKLEPILYQQLSFNDHSECILNRNEVQGMSITRTSDTISLPKWTRLTAQSCKIPNQKFFETKVSENGCFFVTFSNNGELLACVNSEEYDYPIVVYEIKTQKINVQFNGHKTFVYSVNWCNDDRSLLSVSSDQTARIWDVRNKTIQHIQMLPHPSYVYCGKFDPRDAAIVATGCYDRVVRVWCKEKKSTSYELVQELEGHEGFVNSMCFQKEGDLLTADSVGLIIVWVTKKNRRAPSKREWQISRKIKVREMEGVTINTIVLHPMESRILAHSRNNGLRMLDLATGVVLQKYKGLNNQRIQSSACISPCGGLILCGGEDSSLNVWSFETGKYLARYTIDQTYRAVTCVDYHPHDHVLAFSTFGSPAPARLLKFDKDSTGEDIGLKLFTEESDGPYSSAATLSILNKSTEYKRRFKPSSVKASREGDLPGERFRVFRSTKSSRSTEPILSNAENEKMHEDSRLKLDRRLNEMELSVKSNSTNRLYRIIEKIDRILSNTSRSSDDIESGQNIVLEKRYGHKNDDTASGKSSRCRQAEELNLSDDSKIETLRMSKLDIENEINTKRMSRSAKSRRLENMTQSYISPENELTRRKKRSRNVRERSSDGSTYSIKSKSLRDIRRSKSRLRESSAHSDQSCTTENGADFQLEVTKGNIKRGDVAYFADAAYLSKLDKKRARSAKGWRSGRLEETPSNAFSDSAANIRQRTRFVESESGSTPSRKAKSMPDQSSDSTTKSVEKRRLRKVERIENLSLQNKLVSSTPSQLYSQSVDFIKSPEVVKIDNNVKKCDSTSDSGGTYILEKADVETNEDYGLTKIVPSQNSSSNEKKKNSDGSGNSLKSNATFILGPEKTPIPKPRKKTPSQG